MVFCIARGPLQLSGTTFDADTNTWAAQVVTNGGSVSNTSKGYVDTLIKAIKASSLGPNLNSNLIRAWVLANFDSNDHQAFTSIVNPASTEATKSGGFTSTTLGYLSDGTGFIDTKFNLSTDGASIFTIDGNSWGTYDLTSNTSSNANQPMGVNDASGHQYQLVPIYNGNGGHAIQFWDTGTSTSLLGNTNSQGFCVGTRTSHTNARLKMYQSSGLGGTQDSGSNNVGAAGALSNGNFFICARNNLAGSTDSFWGGKLAFAFCGGALTTTQQDDLSTVVNAYMSNLGIAVY